MKHRDSIKLSLVEAFDNRLVQDTGPVDMGRWLHIVAEGSPTGAKPSASSAPDVHILE